VEDLVAEGIVSMAKGVTARGLLANDVLYEGGEKVRRAKT
jgi:hypothetical protein